jgi:hypothetical protein
VKIISREHRGTPMTPGFGMVVFLLCLLAMPVVAVWVSIDSSVTTGIESALGVGLAGLIIGIKSAGNRR